MRGISGNGLAAALAAAVLLAAPAGARAATLYESLVELVRNQKQIKGAEAELQAASERVDEAWGLWYPEFSFTGSYGNEKQNKPTGNANTDQVPRELDFRITQRVWDFGDANAEIRRARLVVEQAQAKLTATRQDIVRRGIEAHLGLIRARKVLRFAEGSVANIRRQAALEDSMVQRGAGLATDVLQAKTQLLGAERRRNDAAAEFRESINVYRRYFNKEPGKIDELEEPRVPFELLPKVLDEAVSVTLQDNPTLRGLRLQADILRETVSQVRSREFFPSLNAIAAQRRKQDVDGVVGDQNEQLFKLELTYSLNLGLTERNTLRAAKGDHLVFTNQYIDARDAYERSVRDHWSNLERNRSTAAFLNNQADIAAEFLELARRERQLGKRSLIDVLAGETALINAQSDATARETEVMLEVFRLIALMGKLEVDVLK